MNEYERAAKRVGTVVANKYELLGVLGVGGMGAVYEALHRYTGKKVALKLLHSRLITSEQHAARFLREAKAAASIGHPNITDVPDAGREPDGTLYIVMDLLTGEDLATAMSRAGLSTAEVVDIAKQMLAGLAAAHERGIIHRDVKPDNVFLTRDDRGNVHVSILDFGIAKHLQGGPDASITLAGTIIGTPYYMSPEQARGDPVDARTDLWSTGAVLFHCLAGRPPFEEENYNKLIVKILTKRAPSLAAARPDLPQWLTRTVDRALEPDATLRWQSAKEMAEALESPGAPVSGLDWDDDPDMPRSEPPAAGGPALGTGATPFSTQTPSAIHRALVPQDAATVDLAAPKGAPGAARNDEQSSPMAREIPMAPLLPSVPGMPPPTTPASWEIAVPPPLFQRAPPRRSRAVLLLALGAVTLFAVLAIVVVLVLVGSAPRDVRSARPGPVPPAPMPVPPPVAPPVPPPVVPAAVDAGAPPAAPHVTRPASRRSSRHARPRRH